jgi:hypothetical protein
LYGELAYWPSDTEVFDAIQEATQRPVSYGIEVPTAQIDQVDLNCLKQHCCRFASPCPANESRVLERG